MAMCFSSYILKMQFTPTALGIISNTLYLPEITLVKAGIIRDLKTTRSTLNN